MPVLNAGVETRARKFAGDRGVNRAEAHLERIGEAFDVARRVVDETGGSVTEGRRGTDGGFIGAIAVAEMQQLRVLRAPPGGFLRAVYLHADTVLPTGSDLRHGEISTRSVAKSKQHTAEIIGLHFVSGVAHFGTSPGKGLHFSQRTAALLMPGGQVSENRGYPGAEDER